jgi:hypothetical protein
MEQVRQVVLLFFLPSVAPAITLRTRLQCHKRIRTLFALQVAAAARSCLARTNSPRQIPERIALCYAPSGS